MFKFLPRSLPNSATVNSTIRSISLFSGAFGATTKMEPSVRSYTPPNPDGPFPYTQADMTPMDPGNDDVFYRPPRFVTHIDDNAIVNLKRYYDAELPRRGAILDFCSSWVSHYPPGVFGAARKRAEHLSRREGAADAESGSGELVVLGTGMNEAELKANPVLFAYSVQDLNRDPEVRVPVEEDGNLKLDASTCVVSIDYLTRPVEVLKSILSQTNDGGRVHLVISNRCFPTKVVGRWLKISEQERLDMVGDYLHWAGWKDIEIVDVVRGGFMTDPLWVVRAKKT